MHDLAPTLRHLILLRMLEARRYGMSISEMAGELGVDNQTIRRDLKLFLRIGIPLAAEGGERGRKSWKLPQSDGCPRLRFAFDEAVALSLARPLLEPLSGTELGEAADRAIQKIRATLSEDALSHFAKLQQVFHFTSRGSGKYESKAEIIDDLTFAIKDTKVVQLTYRSQAASAPAAREIHPYNLISHKGSLYLFAFAPEHGEVRSYKVDRMEKVTTSSKEFLRAPGFDVAQFLAGSFGIYDGDENVTVVVKILQSAVRSFHESKVRPRCEFTTQTDGSLVARFELTSTLEIKSWILSFGASAVILEPDSLREAVAEELQQMLKAYQPTSQHHPRKRNPQN